jgi:hypothetical protein
MKRFTMVEWVTFVGIGSSLLLLMFASGCASTDTIPKKKGCCERLDVRMKQMEKYSRLCKVMVFAEGINKFDKNKKDIQQGIALCKFVFGVDNKKALLTVGPDEDFYQARFYILDGTKRTEKPAKAEGQMDWMDPLPCDPDEFACEEF